MTWQDLKPMWFCLRSESATIYWVRDQNGKWHRFGYWY